MRVAALTLLLTLVPTPVSATVGPHWPGEGERHIVIVDALDTFPMPSTPRTDRLVVSAAAAWSRSPGVELAVEQGPCIPRDGAIVLCRVYHLSSQPTITVGPSPKAAAYTTYEIADSEVTIKRSVVELVWTGFRGCDRECVRARRGVMRYRLCHEIGHALGLPHRELTSGLSCMAHTAKTPDAQDLARVAALHGVEA